MNITMSRTEIMERLNITNDRMKYLVNKNKLSNELLLIGFKLENTYKDGRNTIYEVSVKEIDEIEVYQADRNIKKKDEHIIYVEERLTEGGLKKPRRSFVRELKKEKDVDISESTARRFDNMLIEDECMIKDRKVYLFFNPFDEVFTEISEEEYKAFWRDCSECKYQLSHNHARYKRNEISETVYENNKYIIMNSLGKERGVVALKFDTYKEYTNTKTMLDMIKKHKNRRA